MQDTLYLVLSICAVALTATAIWLAVSIRAAVQKLDKNLDMLERELPPTLDLLRKVGDEAMEATTHLKRATERLEKTAVSAADAADSTLGFLSVQGSRLGRWGMMLTSLVSGVRAAVEAFGRSQSNSNTETKEADHEQR